MLILIFEYTFDITLGMIYIKKIVFDCLYQWIIPPYDVGLYDFYSNIYSATLQIDDHILVCLI